MSLDQKGTLRSEGQTILSIIIPTYNEAENIFPLIRSIKENIPSGLLCEIIIVDDNSPDGTGRIVEEYINGTYNSGGSNIQQYEKDHIKHEDGNCVIRICHRQEKNGLIPAYLAGIDLSIGQNILLMDADFSHPPALIPQFLRELLKDPNCIVIASRYIKGGSTKGWPLRRQIISIGAARIARYGLKVRNVNDPMSNFFAFPRHVLENLTISTKGYKILLEILVKTRGIRLKEIPYTFEDRKSGESKFDVNVILDYIRSVWYLYWYGQKSRKVSQYKKTKRNSVLFLSKAARFFTVGASGLLINYFVSFLLSNGVLLHLWYLYASIIGIITSLTTNFFLNKAWTFEDRNFSVRHTLKQYGLFAGSYSVGLTLQLVILYFLVQSGHLQFGVSLVIAVLIGAISNFLITKKIAFGEKIWS